MITPAFDLSQDPNYLILSARVPYTRTSEFDLYIDGTDLKFYAKPYFLRLTLPGRIVEDGREKATFDVDKGVFTLRVPKETAGEHFEGLQMLTSLLAPKGSRSAKPLVEEIGMEACGGSAEGDEGEEDDDDEEEDFDWQVEQEVYTESSEGNLGSQQMYGFGNQRSGVFARLQEELSDVIDLKDPEGTTAAQRKEARLAAESSVFCHDHYLLDLYEDKVIRGLLGYRPWWAMLGPFSHPQGESGVCFTDDEKEQMRRFNNRSYLLDKTARHQVWLSLVDILLAYAYDVRFTEGEHTVESPWTIRKLSGTLCWLETYSSLQEVLVSFGRRVLCYPLHRHFDLVTAAIRDTAHIMALGKACVLKCLLDIHRVFRENDPAYILNDLYITDYCIWLQRTKQRKVMALAGPLQKVSLQKKDLQLELDVLEEAAALVVEEEDEDEEEGREEHEEEESQKRAPVSVAEAHSSNSSISESGSEELENEEQGCAPSSGGGASGGGGAGRETAKASPLQLRPPSPTAPPPDPSPIPPAPVARSEGEPDGPAAWAPHGSRRLIEELGQHVAEELHIS